MHLVCSEAGGEACGLGRDPEVGGQADRWGDTGEGWEGDRRV